MEEITEENFRDILKSRHPKLFGLDKDDKFAKIGIKIGVKKGYFYLLDTLYDLLEENDIKLSDIEKQYTTFLFSIFGRKDLDELMNKADALSYGICEICGKKIEVSEFQKANKKLIYHDSDFMRCESCASNPKKDFPMSEKHITKEEITKYLTDDSYFYTTVKDFKEMVANDTYDNKIINFNGEDFNTDKFTTFKDSTGSILLSGEEGALGIGKVVIMSVFPIYKKDGLHISYRLMVAKGHFTISKVEF